MKRIIITSLALTAAAALTSCESGPNAQTGTLVGAGTGALVGGVIGHQSGHTTEGALIGAVAGGAVGNAAGANQDRRNANYYGQPQPRVVGYDRYGNPIYSR